MSKTIFPTRLDIRPTSPKTWKRRIIEEKNRIEDHLEEYLIDKLDGKQLKEVMNIIWNRCKYIL